MGNRLMVSLLAVMAVLVVAPMMLAQIPAHPGAAKSTTDLSGIWTRGGGGSRYIQEDPPPLQPWALEIYKRHRVGLRNPADSGLKELDPVTYCFPHGLTRLMMNHPFELVQWPDQGWMGHSTATWQGSALVADTVGFNGKTWLDISGTPHSDALHLVERSQHVNQGSMEVGFLQIAEPI